MYHIIGLCIKCNSRLLNASKGEVGDELQERIQQEGNIEVLDKWL